MKKITSFLISSLVLTILCAQDGSWKKLDSLVNNAIDSLAFPGCQILVLHQGDTLLHSSYGHHTYDKNHPVKLSDLYDLASITKVTTGLPLLMKQYGNGKFDLDNNLATYYTKFKNSNKANLVIRDILSHQSRLQPYFVYWKKALKKNGKFKRRTFSFRQNRRYPTPITDSLFLHNNFNKKVIKTIRKSDLLPDKKMVYSGLFFILLPEILENGRNLTFEQMLYQEIYEPIGARRLLYNPLQRFQKSEIIPTEIDTLFRHKLIHGRVHDEAAAVLGGVSCNAGLFGNAADLAKIFSLYLNDGKINDKSIIATKAIKEFTSYQFPEQKNNRALGFDKPPLEYNEKKSYVSKYASPKSYGHSGFTGTFVWADPEYDLLVVFLSNRTYPYRSHRKLYELNFRPKLHDLIYEIVLDKN